MVTDVRSPGKWVGGKFQSAERIIGLFPASSLYDRYVEPCGGMAHIFFARPRHGEEVYNDLNDLLYNFWKQVQVHGEEIAARLPVLYSRALYYEYYRSLFDGSPLDPVEKAVRWFYVLRSTGTGWIRKSPVGWDNRVSNAHAYLNMRETFTAVQERLRGVLIDNRDVLYVLRKYAAERPRTLVYVDPPYIGAEQYYETPPFPHEQMAASLNALGCYVALSYYPHPKLDEWYPASKWRRITWEQHKPSSIGGNIETYEHTATEMLLCNYAGETPAPSLWD
jgi:DNA adenine methylase